MTVWGAGFSFRFGGGVPVGITPGISGKYAFWLVWDDCGDSGILFMLEGSLDIGLKAQPPITVELNLEIMQGTSLTQLGGGCVSDLEGWAGGVDIGVEALLDADIGIDVTNHGMLLMTLGAGLQTGAGVSAGAHATRKFFIPINVGNCPCPRRWWSSILEIALPGASLVYLAKAIYKLATRESEG